MMGNSFGQAESQKQKEAGNRAKNKNVNGRKEKDKQEKDLGSTGRERVRSKVYFEDVPTTASDTNTSISSV